MARWSRSPPFREPWYVGISRSIFLPGCKFRYLSFSNKRIKWGKISENYLFSALFVNHRYGIRNKPRLNSISPKPPPPPSNLHLVGGKIATISLTFLHSLSFSFPFSPLSLSLPFLISLLGLLGGGGGGQGHFAPHPAPHIVGGINRNWSPLLFSLFFFSSFFLFPFSPQKERYLNNNGATVLHKA